MKGERSRAVIALGSNIAHEGLSGAALIRKACDALQDCGFVLCAKSGIWESAPWPPEPHLVTQPAYVNAIVVGELEARAPDVIVRDLHALEARFGRTRRKKWQARTLDLDLIDLDGRVENFTIERIAGSEEGAVILPHPHAHERAFVLAPLAEAAPAWRHPVLDKTAAELLAGLPPGQALRRLTKI